jgi:hypothetical protein
MRYFAILPNDIALKRFEEDPGLFTKNQLAWEAKLNEFLQTNGMNPYTIMRDGLFVECKDEHELNLLILLFPDFKKLP